MNVFLYTLFIVKVAKIILHHLWKWQEEVWSLQRGRGDAEKESLLQNEPKQFLNLVFIVPKKSEGFCPVINLSKLNSCDEQNHLFLN